MKTVKISDLSGPALDWAVAKCDEEASWILDAASFLPNHRLGRMNYSRDWSLAGPIIERERIATGEELSGKWVAHIKNDTYNGWRYGPTPLIAAMRCYVASRLGDTVEIPEELI